MIPGKMNSREVKRMMQQMGIKSTEYPDVKKVVMEAGNKRYIIENPEVTAITAQGQTSFQIVGTMREESTPLSDNKQPQGQTFPEEDIKLVMEQSGASREKAIEALKMTDGQPADAILKLISN